MISNYACESEHGLSSAEFPISRGETEKMRGSPHPFCNVTLVLVFVASSLKLRGNDKAEMPEMDDVLTHACHHQQKQHHHHKHHHHHHHHHHP